MTVTAELRAVANEIQADLYRGIENDLLALEESILALLDAFAPQNQPPGLIFDFRAFDNHLADVGRACLVCGGTNTHLDEHTYALRAIRRGEAPFTATGPYSLLALLACRDCGFIRLHGVDAGKTKPPVDN